MRGLSTVLMSMLLCLVLTGSAMAYTISDDATGGDCTQIGIWNAGTKTCTMTTDINQPNISPDVLIIIGSSGITLDGNGHRITGPNQYYGTYGIWFGGLSGVNIKNLSIDNFWSNITMISTANNILSNLSISNAVYGIYPAGNSSNIYTRNTVANNQVGIVMNADIQYGNILYQNNFIGNQQHVTPGGGWEDNSYNLPLPIGGNYWDTFDTQAEGCTDSNKDGFCDSYYSFSYSYTDYLPWTVKDGWLDNDMDSYNKAVDCNDNNASIHLGATEIKFDGIDQDCNGYDLTLNITKAVYVSRKNQLTVEATSSLGAGANLSLAGYGPMTWKASQSKWTITVSGNPGTVIVSGIEGSESAQVVAQ